MKRSLISPGRLALCVLTLCLAGATHVVRAEDLHLADDARFPGELWLSQNGSIERLVHRRDAQPNAAWPRAVPKLGQVAIAPDGKIFYCSGVDGALMHLLDSGVEAQAFEIEGQIRDLACTGEENVVYFSVVATPQNGEPLADGQLFRCDLANGQLTQIATIGQADLGGNWWGTFTIRNGVIYLVTADTPSRMFTLTAQGLQPVFTTNPLRITGLTTGPTGDFWLAMGDNTVIRTGDFVNLQLAFQAQTRVSDVALRTPREALRVVVEEYVVPVGCYTHFVCIRPIPVICFWGCCHPVPWCHHHNHLHYVNHKHLDPHFAHDKIKDAINGGNHGVISHVVLNQAIQDRLSDSLKGKLPGLKPGIVNLGSKGNLPNLNIPNLGQKLGLPNPGGTVLNGNGGFNGKNPITTGNLGPRTILTKPLNLGGTNAGGTGNANGNNGGLNRGTVLTVPNNVIKKFDGQFTPRNLNPGNGNSGNNVPQFKSFTPKSSSGSSLRTNFNSSNSGNGGNNNRSQFSRRK